MSMPEATCCDETSQPPMPLTCAGADQEVRIASLAAGSGARQRLADLGLLTGTRLRVIRPSGGGPMLIELRGSRFALGRGLAAKIMIQMIQPGTPRRPQSLPMTA